MKVQGWHIHFQGHMVVGRVQLNWGFNSLLPAHGILPSTPGRHGRVLDEVCKRVLSFHDVKARADDPRNWEAEAG